MNGIMEDNILKAVLSGHIDSANVPAVEAGIMQLREGCPHEGLILDLKDLTYISSAGLRMVLRLGKLEPSFRLVNASPEVYEILDITGFTEMFSVEKACRVISVEGCEAIGQGANGVVYRIDNETVVKVYRNPDCLPDVKRERELARKAFVLGIPTAIPYDVVRVGESYGSVFELVNARSFSKLIAACPEQIDHYVDLYVEVMQKLHSTHTRPGDVPDIREFAMDFARYAGKVLPEKTGERLQAMMEAVPERDTLLHGDYHTNNIVMQNDEVLLLDMDTLCCGHPVFELASVFMAFVGFGEQDPTVVEKFLKLPYETAKLFWKKALKRYLDTEDQAYIDEVEKKAMVIGYARLLRRTMRRDGFGTDAGRAVIERCAGRIGQLVGELDSLCF